MVLHVALLACLVSVKGDTRLPPRPDFAAMIPQTSTTFLARQRDTFDPAHQEVAALAKYLNRLWDFAANRNESSQYALDLLTVVQQFDSALMVLNPNPTVGEALARVYAYQPVLALLRQHIAYVDAHPESVNARCRFQFHAQLHRMNRLVERQYGPVFARALISHFRV